MDHVTSKKHNIPLQRIILRILVLLTVFAGGSLVAMIVVNRSLVAQLAVYGDSYMPAASAILDFMDDMLPYIAGNMISLMVLIVITLTMWLYTKFPDTYKRYGVAIVLLLLVIMAIWLLAGHNTDVPSATMMMPTPQL